MEEIKRQIGEEVDYDFSDDEQDMDWREMPVRFGMYRGQTLGEVMKTKRGRSYVQYLLSWDELRDDMRKACEVATRDYTAAKQKRRRLK